MDELWQFIKDNAAAISAVAAVIGVLIGAATLFKRGKKTGDVSASHGVATGRDVRGSSITVSDSVRGGQNKDDKP